MEIKIVKQILEWNEDVSDEVKQLQTESESYSTDLTPVYKEKWSEIKAILSKCPSAAECNAMMRATGLDFSECEELLRTRKNMQCNALRQGSQKSLQRAVALLFAVFRQARGGGLQII